MPSPEPFVLLDFADGPRLLRNPSRIVEARQATEVPAALDQLTGQRAAGFIGYDAGLALEPKLKELRPGLELGAPPLLWFGTFEEELDMPPLPDPAGAWLGRPRPLIRQDVYCSAVERIQQHILDGDVYQANYTFQADVSVAGHPLALYAQLRARARADWGAVVFTGSHWILSCSPELFFTMDASRIVARPMKGTALAGSDPQALRDDEKQRAENLMIVDLMRNDLARVAQTGSVEVPELFTVESYPTVLQMTSTVTARARPDVRPVDVVRSIFPCGSVTGAPKIRAMELIREVEPLPRGPYTGAIGCLSANDARFNVAIRTLVMPDGAKSARLGLGSGIVADSDPEAEWRECLAKGAFVASRHEFELIETMRVSDGQVALLEFHLDRLESSSAALDFTLDREVARAAICRECSSLTGQSRLRLSLKRDGGFNFDHGPLPEWHAGPDVRLVRREIGRHDFRLRHKTSLRGIYDAHLSACDAVDVLFVDPDGFLTEGCFTNIFLRRDGRLLTPPVTRGLLPGVLRRMLLDSGEAVEADIHVDDLRGGLMIGNALRGLTSVTVKR